MVNGCVVVGCKNNSRTSDKSFYAIPTIVCHQGEKTQQLSSERRRLWISRINRKDWTPAKYSRVCSDHFVEGVPALLYKPHLPNWAPSLKLGYPYAEGVSVNEDMNRMEDVGGGKETTCLVNGDSDDKEQVSAACMKMSIKSGDQALADAEPSADGNNLESSEMEDERETGLVNGEGGNSETDTVDQKADNTVNAPEPVKTEEIRLNGDKEAKSSGNPENESVDKDKIDGEKEYGKLNNSKCEAENEGNRGDCKDSSRKAEEQDMSVDDGSVEKDGVKPDAPGESSSKDKVDESKESEAKKGESVISRKRRSSGNGEGDTAKDPSESVVEKKAKIDDLDKKVTVNKSVSGLTTANSVIKTTGATSVLPITLNIDKGMLANQAGTVRMVIPSVSSTLLTQPGQHMLISQGQTPIFTNQAFTLYPQLAQGTSLMPSMQNTVAKRLPQAATSVTSSVSHSYPKNHKQADVVDFRPPNNSLEMIELVRWELKQGMYHRPKNFRLKPDSELGPMSKFLRDLGQDLVKESVYSDLVKIQNRRNNLGKLTEKEKSDFEKLKSVHTELDNKVGPLKLKFTKSCKCGFRSESKSVMSWHQQHPHIDGNDLRCAVCSFETRNASVFAFHMESEHNLRARFFEKSAFWECSLCPYENNQRTKLTQHRFRCSKTFKLNLNLHPSWLPGPETNYCLEKIFYKNPILQNMARMNQQIRVNQQQQKQIMPIPAKNQGQLTNVQINAQVKINKQPVNQVNKGATVSTSAVRNPLLLAGLGQTIQNRQALEARNTPSQFVNMMRGQTPGIQVANMNLSAQRKVTPSVGSKSIIVPQNTSAPRTLQPMPQNASGFEVCEICGGYVKDRTALRIHFFYAHRIDMPHGVFDRVHPPLYCATCFARFWTAQGLQKHLDVHKEDSSGGVAGKCIVCLHRVPNILMHMKIVHNKAFVNFLRECKCIFCGTKFGNKTVVENHMAAVHGVVVKSGGQPAAKPQPKKPTPNPKSRKAGGKGDSLVKGSVCVLCNLNFGRNVDLTRHCMRVHHTCMKCGMVVEDKVSLLRHSCLDSPSGLRNCEICGEEGFHPAYHVKHIRDKHLRKLSVRLKRLDRRTVDKWLGRRKVSVPPPRRVVQETIELSDDENEESNCKKRKRDSEKEQKGSSEVKETKEKENSNKDDDVAGAKGGAKLEKMDAEPTKSEENSTKAEDDSAKDGEKVKLRSKSKNTDDADDGAKNGDQSRSKPEKMDAEPTKSEENTTKAEDDSAKDGEKVKLRSKSKNTDDADDKCEKANCDKEDVGQES